MGIGDKRIMAEFIRPEEKVVNVGEPVIFENNTDSDFSVSAAIVFRKSGLYDVSIVGRRIIISKVAERKTGHWIKWGNRVKCDQCAITNRYSKPFCPNCGARMLLSKPCERGEKHEID